MRYDLDKITEAVRALNVLEGSEIHNLAQILLTAEILNKVDERKERAKEYKSMAELIIERKGDEVVNQGDYLPESRYQESGLNISSFVHNNIYGNYNGCSVTISVAEDIVFRTDRVSEIRLYHPGDWEKQFKEIYESVKLLKPKKVPKLEIPQPLSERELKDLLKNFGLE